MDIYKEFTRDLESKFVCSFNEMQQRILNTKLITHGTYTKDLVEIIKKYKNIDLSLLNPLASYEENFVYFSIGIIQAKTIQKQLDFIFKNAKFIDSWAVTDSSYKYLEFLPFEEELIYVKNLIETDQEFAIRYGYLILLKYIEKDNIETIFSLLKNTDMFYVYMMEAWLLSFIYIKYPTETYTYLKSSNIDLKIKLKAISKVIDSYRVSHEEKTKLKELRTYLKSL